MTSGIFRQPLDATLIAMERDGLRAEVERLRTELTALRKDKQRLDWLELYGTWPRTGFPDLRAAIDHVLKAEDKS